MQRSGEDVRVKRKRAGVFKHGLSGRSRIDSATQRSYARKPIGNLAVGLK